MVSFRRKKTEPVGRHVNQQRGSAPVFSYRSSRSWSDTSQRRGLFRSAADESKRSNRRAQTKRFLINLPTYLALLLILISICYAITLSPNPRLQIIDNGQPTVLLRDKQAYVEAGKKLMESSVVNYTKPTIDTGHIASEMQKQFPELGSVNVSIPLIDRHPIMQVTYAAPKLILQTANGSYVLSESGIALVKTTDVPSGVKLNQPLVIDQSGLKLKQGDRALTDTSVDFILTVHDELAAKGLGPDSMTLPTTPEELDVRLPGQSYYLKFNLQADAQQQVGAYLALKQVLDSNGTVPKEYIDLRVDERAYYK